MYGGMGEAMYNKGSGARVQGLKFIDKELVFRGEG
jgi:hypothetical protein